MVKWYIVLVLMLNEISKYFIFLIINDVNFLLLSFVVVFFNNLKLKVVFKR